MFGQPQQQSLFGAPQQQQTGSSLFGGGATSGFGGAQSTTATPSLFGSQPPKPAASFFGQQPQQTQSSTSLGGFGSGTTTTTTNLFGQPQQQPAPTLGGATSSLFGQQQPKTPAAGSLSGAQQPASSGSLFGQQPPASGQFGQPKTATTASLFGQPKAPAAPSTSLFGAPVVQPEQPQVVNQQPQIADLMRQMAEYWNTSSPHCQFKHYFYNMVHPSEVQYYQPSPTEDPVLYNLAQKNNPDQSCMVPVLAIGFDDLKKRSDIQKSQIAAHEAKLAEIQAQSTALSRSHSLENVVKADEIARRQVILEHKVFILMKFVHLLRNKGYPLRESEESLRAKLTSLQEELKKPEFSKGRIHELQLHLSRVGRRGADDGVLELTDQDSEKLLSILGNHKGCLSKMTDKVLKFSQETKLIKRGFEDARRAH